MTKIGLAREIRADKAWGHQKRQPLAPWLVPHHLGLRRVSLELLHSVFLLVGSTTPWEPQASLVNMQLRASCNEDSGPGPLSTISSFRKTYRNHLVCME